MKIVHLCLSCFYIDGYSYQENELVARNVKDGHDVTVIASTETYGKNKELTYLEPSEYIGTDGAKVIRVPYKYQGFLPFALVRKIRRYNGVIKHLKNEKPDVILFHGMCALELNTVANYVANTRNVTLFVDSHEDFHNSAQTSLSKWVLHYLFYRNVLRRSLPYIEKVLCLSLETKESFVEGFYGIPKDKTELYPLGGVILDKTAYKEKRQKKRAELGVSPEETLFVQSGKMDKSKKLLASLRAFSQLHGQHLTFIIAGHLYDDIAEQVKTLIEKDKRIQYIGWQQSDDLYDLLCAADVYVQPGTQSSTMQTSLCCRCAVILHDYPSHHVFVNRENGWLLNGELSINKAMQEAASNKELLGIMSDKSLAIAREYLDYKKLATRLYDV